MKTLWQWANCAHPSRPGSTIYFVWRPYDPDDYRKGGENLENASGHVRRFRTRDGAVKMVERLNRDAKQVAPEIPGVLLCGCGYDLRVRGHCGSCNRYFSICLGCHLPTQSNRCNCKVKTRHPDHPEEWA